MKNSVLNSILGGIVGVVLTVIAIAGISYVIAAPTLPPPNGNPSFPLQGPGGPTGATGPAGPQGPQGTFGTCRMRSSSCSSPAFGGCETTISQAAGWLMTGGDCGTNLGHSSLFAYNKQATSTSITCDCHDFSSPQAGTCFAYIWECQ